MPRGWRDGRRHPPETASVSHCCTSYRRDPYHLYPQQKITILKSFVYLSIFLISYYLCIFMFNYLSIYRCIHVCTMSTVHLDNNFNDKCFVPFICKSVNENRPNRWVIVKNAIVESYTKNPRGNSTQKRDRRSLVFYVFT